VAGVLVMPCVPIGIGMPTVMSRLMTGGMAALHVHLRLCQLRMLRIARFGGCVRFIVTEALFRRLTRRTMMSVGIMHYGRRARDDQ
jgi:hypothetical protein